MASGKKKIVAALSGGVDSSVAAAIYLEKGYEVIGVTLKLRPCDNVTEKRKSCCGAEDNIQAGLVAKTLGIPHYFHDAQADFKNKVLRPSWQDYIHGITPNPCVLCNNHIKFGALLDFALRLGAEGIITGHYCQLQRHEDGHVTMFKGEDSRKDQSYFLALLTQQQLQHSFFPLGDLTKPEVREIAASLSLPNAQKQESQDACFGYKGEAFSQTLCNLFDYKGEKGFIVDVKGNKLKEHNGIHHFTIGQRKGLGVALGKPAYVVKIDADTNDVVVSTEEQDLISNELTCENINWINPVADEFRCQVKIRYQTQPVTATFKRLTETTGQVFFERPVRAVTAGQAIAFYKDTEVLGGGWIVPA